MTLPVFPNQIEMSDVNVELNSAFNTQRAMSHSNVRILAARPSGQIAMSDLHGKTWALNVVLTPNDINVVGGGASPSRDSTANVTGGSGSYSYSWSILSQHGLQNVNLTNATSQTATFSASMPVGGYAECFARCTVTDISTGITGFADIHVYFER